MREIEREKKRNRVRQRDRDREREEKGTKLSEKMVRWFPLGKLGVWHRWIERWIRYREKNKIITQMARDNTWTNR